MNTLVGYAESKDSDRSLLNLTNTQFRRIFGERLGLRRRKCPQELRNKALFTRNPEMESFVTEQVADNLRFLGPETVVISKN